MLPFIRHPCIHKTVDELCPCSFKSKRKLSKLSLFKRSFLQVRFEVVGIIGSWGGTVTSHDLMQCTTWLSLLFRWTDMPAIPRKQKVGRAGGKIVNTGTAMCRHRCTLHSSTADHAGAPRLGIKHNCTALHVHVRDLCTARPNRTGTPDTQRGQGIQCLFDLLGEATACLPGPPF